MAQDAGGKFAQTYESSMTRLFRFETRLLLPTFVNSPISQPSSFTIIVTGRNCSNSEGRTETVRPVSNESVAFVRSLEDGAKTNAQRIDLFRAFVKRLTPRLFDVISN